MGLSTMIAAVVSGLTVTVRWGDYRDEDRPTDDRPPVRAGEQVLGQRAEDKPASTVGNHVDLRWLRPRQTLE